MPNKEEIVQEFYRALNNCDYKKVNSLYHEDALYEDEIIALKGKEIHALWYTACQPEMHLKATCRNIVVDGNTVRTDWTISYTIESLNRNIELDEKGVFQFKGDKIIKHSDSYDFWMWCTQAFGLIGKAMGWSNWLRKKVRTQVRKSVLSNLYAAQLTNINND